MEDSQPILVLPSPGKDYERRPSIEAPSEAAFTGVFGSLLPKARYVQLPFGKAAFYDLGTSANSTEKGECVLLVHGVQTPALGLLPLARALQVGAPNRHYVLVDLWGHGLSDAPFMPYTAQLFHHLFDAILEQLHWRAAHLIGFSLGGALVASYTASRPAKVQSFVLIAPAGLIRTTSWTDQQRAYLGEGDELAAQKWIVDDFLEDGGLVVPSDWQERVARGEVVAEAVRDWQTRNHTGHTASVVACIRHAGVVDSPTPFVQAVQTKIPSLVILGGSDSVCSEGMAREVGLSNVEVVNGATHAVVRSHVDKVKKEICGFWLSGLP